MRAKECLLLGRIYWHDCELFITNHKCTFIMLISTTQMCCNSYNIVCSIYASVFILGACCLGRSLSSTGEGISFLEI